MTTNRFVKGEPSASKTERVDLKQPKFCEIPGCKTRWVPPPKGVDKGHHVCGAADFLVKDRFDILRGICSVHYLRELSAAGKLPNQDLLDADGRYNPVKVRSHWDSLAQIEIAETAKRTRYGRNDA